MRQLTSSFGNTCARFWHLYFVHPAVLPQFIKQVEHLFSTLFPVLQPRGDGLFRFALQQNGVLGRYLFCAFPTALFLIRTYPILLRQAHRFRKQSLYLAGRITPDPGYICWHRHPPLHPPAFGNQNTNGTSNCEFHGGLPTQFQLGHI